METDEQFKYAAISLYVVDGKTGRVVFDKNGGLGLAPASCQKLITSVTAFELLGSSYRFKTYLAVDKPGENKTAGGNVYVIGSGDPTLGSNRWQGSSAQSVLDKILVTLKQHNIQFITGGIIADDHLFETDAIPGGWVWEDIGNYYGAGAWGINWRENQYDITFKTGRAVNDSTTVLSTMPPVVQHMYSITNFVTTGASGSGDNSYLFSAPFGNRIIARGTVPPAEKGFTIQGATPNPPALLLAELTAHLKSKGISINGVNRTYSESNLNNETVNIPVVSLMDSIVSPPLDSINYWFLKKSVNLFGEALLKTIGATANGKFLTVSGIEKIKSFWSKKGIDPAAINIVDGCGLSPANRVTAASLVTVLEYARGQKWYNSFYKALPVINNITMKDGYIGGVRTYAGYVNSSNGGTYTFCVMVNNFDGSPGSAREKIWRLLDVMK